LVAGLNLPHPLCPRFILSTVVYDRYNSHRFLPGAIEGHRDSIVHLYPNVIHFALRHSVVAGSAQKINSTRFPAYDF
jgi:hypothetical protein